tara:strand:- start:260 stop:469 length:210 start_codon:yes stop_codon:yes gene_type:complete
MKPITKILKSLAYIIVTLLMIGGGIVSLYYSLSAYVEIFLFVLALALFTVGITLLKNITYVNSERTFKR